MKDVKRFSIGEFVAIPALSVKNGVFLIKDFQTVPGSHELIAIVSCVGGENPPDFYKRTRCAVRLLCKLSPLETLVRQAFIDEQGER